MQKLFRSPWLEVNIMLVVLIISYVALGLITGSAQTPSTATVLSGSRGAISTYFG